VTSLRAAHELSWLLSVVISWAYCYRDLSWHSQREKRSPMAIWSPIHRQNGRECEHSKPRWKKRLSCLHGVENDYRVCYDVYRVLHAYDYRVCVHACVRVWLSCLWCMWLCTVHVRTVNVWGCGYVYGCAGRVLYACVCVCVYACVGKKFRRFPATGVCVQVVVYSTMCMWLLVCHTQTHKHT
jgi:hypothetical protein